MIKVKEFSNYIELEEIFRVNHITREQIIDIKWSCTSHIGHGLLIYEQ